MAAAYAALVSLSQIIHQILHPPPPHHFLIPTQQIQSLQDHVNGFIDFLEKYSTPETEDLEKRIVGAAYEAQDIIESYVVSQIQSKYESNLEIKGSTLSCLSMKKGISKLPPIHKVLKKRTVLKLIKKFISIGEKVEKIRIRKGVEDMRPDNPTAASSSRSVPGGKNLMIGFDEHLIQVKTALATDEFDLQIIPVVGMGGIGKTTLATHVYKDAYIVERFDFRAWVSVSLEYNLREIIVALLQQINSNIEVKGLSADLIGNLLYKKLFGRRYFVVLDDMWDIQAWDMLKTYLPNNGNGSRILVTTRLLNLAEDIKSSAPYQLALLDNESSWTLMLEVFGKENFPLDELEEIGKSIARKCRGLPLALVVIGRLLAKSEKTRAFWEYVEQDVTSTANDENDQQCMKVLRLSYIQLPVYLKPCFLYLAVFPKNVEIRTSRLIRLWVAEGFIKPASGKTLEEVAEGYLEDLFDRNLVMVKKQGHTGKVKTCSIHDLIRDLCTREVGRDKFLCFPKLHNPIISSHMRRERRLSIHIGTSNKKAHEVLRSATVNRSFLSYSKWESRRCIVRRLNLLRLLDVVDFYSMEEILRLFNSRYITCSIPWELQTVSSMISLMWNLQTLVVPGNVSLPSEIWKMPQLRHLKMPGITLPDPPEDQGESQSIIVLQNLQTLSTIKDFVFREQILQRIPNLKKMGIHCDAIEKIGSFCLSNLASLKKLESLVLAFRGSWENMAFSSSLKKLSLSYCQIPWEDMSVVGLLPNLEVLKLQTRAAKGQMWYPNSDEFCRLKFLLIDGCEMETWVVDDDHFPCLEHLHLVDMKIKEIPIEFAEIVTLQTINLNYCNRSLFASAKRISGKRESIGYEEVQVRSFHSEPTPSGKDNVVGLKDEADKIIGYLNEKTDRLDVISIIGMPGLGKTTLAGKIFHDPDIKYEFPTRIWVHVSQEFTPKEVFLAILRQMMMRLDETEYGKKSLTQLADEIAIILETGKFLIVMDDVRAPADWDKLCIAMPEHNMMGKVLITTHQLEVGKYVNRCREPHRLRFLTLGESCELLQWEVFNKPEFPPDLDTVGREIAGNCDGLPLAIVVIGGVLATKVSTSAVAWQKVSRSVTTFLQLDPQNRMDKIISMSYEKLPYHLKECFLYLGMFPEDFEIPTWKLIQMWIAEGLIQAKDGISMEESAENYLDYLINRNLIIVDKLKADGRVKSCRIHDMLRDFCIIEGGKDRENFLQEIKQSSDGGFQPSVTEGEKHLRLCIHSNVVNFLSKNPRGPYLRSFVTFSEDVDIPTEYISAISAAFKLLGVLEAKPLKFSKIPSDFYHLVHLKYLALSIKLDSSSKAATLPKAFTKLWNIQTLIVDTTSRTLDIKADIMSFTQLRHLKTNACTTLVKPGKDSNEGEKLQTLGTMSPESCTEAIFDRARNLKKLSIRGKIALFLDGKIGSFESLKKLSNLEKLKLLNDMFPKSIVEGKLVSLPPAYQFPRNIRSLTLFHTHLDWSHMSVIGSLDKLQVLKLKDYAFIGSTWEVGTRGLDSLEVLHIGRTDLSIWVAKALHFPNLKRLELHNCERLKEVPIGLADIQKFEYLDLQRCKEAAASARKIGEKKNVSSFKLSIFP